MIVIQHHMNCIRIAIQIIGDLINAVLLEMPFDIALWLQHQIFLLGSFEHLRICKNPFYLLRIPVHFYCRMQISRRKQDTMVFFFIRDSIQMRPIHFISIGLIKNFFHIQFFYRLSGLTVNLKDNILGMPGDRA